MRTVSQCFAWRSTSPAGLGRPWEMANLQRKDVALGCSQQSPEKSTRDSVRWNQPNQSGISVCFLKKLGHNSSFFLRKKEVWLAGVQACVLLASHGNPQPRARGSRVLRLRLPTETSFPRRWFSEEQICPDRIEPAFPEQPECFKPGVQSTKAGCRNA